jgi:hypothetical protein
MSVCIQYDPASSRFEKGNPTDNGQRVRPPGLLPIAGAEKCRALRELKAKLLPVVATGGYAKLIAARLPEISAVEPNLALEGLRLVWAAASAAK